MKNKPLQVAALDSDGDPIPEGKLVYVTLELAYRVTDGDLIRDPMEDAYHEAFPFGEGSSDEASADVVEAVNDDLRLALHATGAGDLDNRIAQVVNELKIITDPSTTRGAMLESLARATSDLAKYRRNLEKPKARGRR